MNNWSFPKVVIITFKCR